MFAETWRCQQFKLRNRFLASLVQKFVRSTLVRLVALSLCLAMVLYEIVGLFSIEPNGSNSTVEKCASVSTTNPNNTFIGYNASDGGIPSVLGLNIGIWLVLIMIFSMVRQMAWDYGRLGLINKGRWARAVYNRQSAVNPDDELLNAEKVADSDEKSLFGWIWTVIKLSPSTIRAAGGQDFGHFLSFERHLIVLQAIITLLSIGVILPSNYSGNLVNERFAKTTVANLDRGSNVYWLHNVFSVLYLIITIVIMRFYARRLSRRQKKQSAHTLMITQVPVDVTSEQIEAHFKEAYPEAEVVDVQFGYDVDKLAICNALRVKATSAYEASLEIAKASGEPHMTRIGPFNSCCLCLCCGKQVNGEEYYFHKVKALCDACEHIRANVKRLEIAFVTLSDSAIAEEIAVSYRPGKQEAVSSVTQNIHSGRWSVKLAPVPENIRWKHLSVGYFLWVARFVVLNAFLCAFLFFWTTPLIITSSLGNLKSADVTRHIPRDVAESAFFTVWLPTLLLWTVTALLPIAVAFTVRLEGHWTKSDAELYTMRKTFLFLLLMALILPSLGLASLEAFTQLHNRESILDQLQCIFLPNNGGFFISYVILCAFIGTAAELLRIPQLVGYVCSMQRASTTKQKEEAMRAAAGQFQFGVEYAWLIMIFGISLVFSITCPLITVFGLAYLILKYFVDKYNLYFALEPPKRMDEVNIHHTAVNFVILCAFLLQLSDLFFSLLRLRQIDDHTIFALVMLMLTLGYIIASMLFGHLAYLTPFKETFEPRNDQGRCPPVGSYCAPILTTDFTCPASHSSVEASLHTVAGRSYEATNSSGYKRLSSQSPEAGGYQTFS